MNEARQFLFKRSLSLASDLMPVNDKATKEFTSLDIEAC